MDIFKEIYNTEGRLNRESYFKQIILILIIVYFVIGIPIHLGIAIYTGDRSYTTASFDNPVTQTISIFYYILTVMPRIRRLHDLGHSGYFLLVAYIILAIITLLNELTYFVLSLVFSLYLLVTPGDKGANKYGVNESALKVDLSKKNVSIPTTTLEQGFSSNILKEIFNTEGRLNRLRYIKYMLLLAIIAGVATFVTSSMATFLTGNPTGFLVKLITGIWAIAAGAGNITLMIRRLHDLDKTGWFAILAIIPAIGFIFSIYLFCAKGTDGYNKYGADPLTY